MSAPYHDLEFKAEDVIKDFLQTRAEVEGTVSWYTSAEAILAELSVPYIAVICPDSSPFEDADAAMGNVYRNITVIIRINTTAKNGQGIDAKTARAYHSSVVGAVMDALYDITLCALLNDSAVNTGIEFSQIDEPRKTIEAVNYGYISQLTFNAIANPKEV